MKMRWLAALVLCATLLAGCADGQGAALPDPVPTENTQPDSAPSVSAENTREEFLAALAKTEGKITAFRGEEWRGSDKQPIQQTASGGLWLLDEGNLYRLYTPAKPVTDVRAGTPLVTEVEQYWLCDYMTVCYGKGGVLTLVGSGDTLRTMSLPETFLERAFTVLDYQDGYLLCAENDETESARLWLYNIAEDTYTGIDRFYYGWAAMLEGEVYYSCADETASTFELKVFHTENGQIETLQSATDTPIAKASFYERTVEWSVAAPINSGESPALQAWCVDDDTCTWTVWEKEAPDGHLVLWKDEQMVLTAPIGEDRQDGYISLYRYDPLTDEKDFLLYVPKSGRLYKPIGEKILYVYDRADGAYLYKYPLPTV